VFGQASEHETVFTDSKAQFSASCHEVEIEIVRDGMAEQNEDGDRMKCHFFEVEERSVVDVVTLVVDRKIPPVVRSP
jgi:hypothetical protein